MTTQVKASVFLKLWTEDRRQRAIEEADLRDMREFRKGWNSMRYIYARRAANRRARKSK